VIIVIEMEIEVMDIEDILMNDHHLGQDHVSAEDIVKIKGEVGQIDMMMMIEGTIAVIVVVVEKKEIETKATRGRDLVLEKNDGEVKEETIKKVQEEVVIEVVLIIVNANGIIKSKKERKCTKEAMMSIEKQEEEEENCMQMTCEVVVVVVAVFLVVTLGNINNSLTTLNSNSILWLCPISTNPITTTLLLCTLANCHNKCL
jgi:hypothetical protein